MSYDTKYTNNAVCPHCGYVHLDSWEFELDGEEESEMDCHSCGKEFLVCREMTITYNTRIVHVSKEQR